MARTFNRTVVKDLQQELQTKLSELEESLGAKIHVGNASFTPNHVTFKVEVANIVDGQAKTKEVVDFEDLCQYYGFAPKDLGRTFVSQGETFEIVGLARKARKYPIICKNVANGKRYKFPIYAVAQGLDESNIYISKKERK